MCSGVYRSTDRLPGAVCRLSVVCGGEQSRVSAALPLFVGVFVDCSAAEMNRVAEAVGLDLIQLHGNEPPHIAQQLNRPAIRVVHVIPNSTTAEECIQRCQQMSRQHTHTRRCVVRQR